VRDAEVLAAGEQKIVLERIGRRKRDRVDENVDFRKYGGNLREDRVDLLVARYIAAERAPRSSLAQVFQQLFGLALQPLRLVGEHQRRPRLGQLLRHAVGDAAFIGQAEDDGHFALQIDHATP